MYTFPKEVDELNLQSFSGPHPPPPTMSMDEYDRWIDEMNRDVVVSEQRENARKRLPVARPFKILD